MASMSVKNRVAMFEHGGGSKQDEKQRSVTPNGQSIKRSTTPNNHQHPQSFFKATSPVGSAKLHPTTPTVSSSNKQATTGQAFLRPSTPTGQAFNRPSTPVGQAFIRPKTPTAKGFNQNTSHESPRENRNSWPWPTEEGVIPAPDKNQSVDDKRRFSSPYLLQSNAPVILPQKSPKVRSSLGTMTPSNSQRQSLGPQTSPFKHLQNQESRKGSIVAQHKLDFSMQLKQGRNILPMTKPAQKEPKSRAPSPDPTLSNSGSLDENKAPRASDAASQRNKALQLARSRNSLSKAPGPSPNVKENNKTIVDDKNIDEHSSSSSHSSETNNELISINRHPLMTTNSANLPSSSSVHMKSLVGLTSLPGPQRTTESKSLGTEEDTRSSNSLVFEQHRARSNSRAEKLSHVLRRASTPESTADSMDASVLKTRSQSPMPGVRGARTVSKVSHQEARKALLQAAQRKKEKADEAKELENAQMNAIIDHDSGKASIDYSSMSKQSGNEAADRLALRAANVLAIKHSKIIHGSPTTKSDSVDAMCESVKDTEGSTNGSIVSVSSADRRRMNHPALVARSSPRIPLQGDRSFQLLFPDGNTEKMNTEKAETKTDASVKPFSEELFSSFRHFKESRPEPASTNKGSQGNSLERSDTTLTADMAKSLADHQARTIIGGHQNNDTIKTPPTTQGRPPQPQIIANPAALRSPNHIKEAVNSGHGFVFQNFEYSSSSPANNDNATGRFSIDSSDSPFMEQEESLHSTSEHKFERKYADGFGAIGQPKYAAPRQMFQQQEGGGYLSSLSSNTFSNQSLISGPNEQHLHHTFRVNPLGEMSPGPSMHSMRSGHSFAHSIVSVSPRVETSKENNEVECMLGSPSKHSTSDPWMTGRATPVGVPAQIDEEEGSEPTVGPSLGESNEPSVESSIMEGKCSKDVPTATVNATSNATKSTTITIQTSYSAAEAPPGFVFHDEEDTDGSNETSRKKSDPIGMSFDRNSETINNGGDGKDAENIDGTEVVEVSQEATTECEVQIISSHSGKHVDKSSSTKGTVSTSLRSGLSSIQNGTSGRTPSKDHVGEDVNVTTASPREGSFSIRTGLSGLQNPSDLEGSASMRSVSVSMKSTAAIGNDSGETATTRNNGIPQDPPQLKNPPIAQGPAKRLQFDTIVEADDEESSDIRAKTETPTHQPQAGAVQLRLHQASAIGQQSTATTDTSSQSDHGKNNKDDSDNSGLQRAKKMLPPALTPMNTRLARLEEDVSVSSSQNSSRHSRWKMKMPNVIKSVLAKASPRNGHTPNSRGALNEKTGFSTSDDEEEDIFGGLEDDVSKFLGEPPKKPNTKNALGKITAKRSNRQPPSQNKFFNSGHTRKSEPPRALEIKDVPTPSRRSVRSETRTPPIARRKTPENSKMTLTGLKKRLTSPLAASNQNPNPYAVSSSNDRSGTYVEQEMEPVNSDITSSILGGPFQRFGRRPRTPKTGIEEEVDDKKAHAKTPKAKTAKRTPSSTKSRSSKKSKTPQEDNQSISNESKKSKNSGGKDTLLDAEDDTKLGNETTTLLIDEPKLEEETEEEKKEEPPSMFMNFGCGLSDAFTAVASVCHFGAKDEEPEETKVVIDDDEGGTFVSAGSKNSSSHLTELEKRVWNEWDKLDSTFNKKTTKPLVETKEEQQKKREVARGKLLEIANSAISSQMTKEGEQSGASGSYTTGSSSADSGDSGESSGMSGSRSSSEGQSSAESRSYFSGSDAASDLVSTEASKMTTPILLSFSQRSLIEKFTKQLSTVGVEVLKLNKRKQWQVRYFTVSKEQIALIAHEANSKSGAEVAQCPKALLWLKKFNAKNGNYGLSNIDKQGHGGMLLVNLKDIHVSNKQDVENPLPKKLADKFKDSVLVNFEYQFNNEKRHIEFRCKDNDEAQFLCTCMRVIRDLLKREQALRLKTQQTKGLKKK